MSTATTPSTATTWTIDPAHTGVHFSIKHLVFSTVRGQFGNVSGSVTLDPERPDRSSVHAVIDAASIDTRESQRDAHLRSPDFLDVEWFPTIEFRSTEIRPAADGLTLRGDLTIHGVTRPVELAVETSGAELTDPWGNQRRVGTVTTRINRKDFGLTWNVALEAGGFVVGDELKIEIDVQLVRQAAAAA